MKKGILLLIGLFIFSLSYAQTELSKGISDMVAPNNQVHSIIGNQVPSSYLSKHCFIQNTSHDSSYFSISYNNSIWSEKGLRGLGSADIPVSDSVYLKIWTEGKGFYQLTGYPSKYYKIQYDAHAKRWIITH